MKLNAFQVARAKHLVYYRTLAWKSLVVFASTLGVLGVLAWILNFVTPVPNLFLASSLIGVTLMLIVVSWQLYVNFLAIHPEFMWSDAARAADPTLSCDYRVLEFLIACKKEETPELLVARIFSYPPMKLAMYRIGLTEQTAGGLLSHPFSEERIDAFLAQALPEASAAHRRISMFDLVRFLLSEGSVRQGLERSGVTLEEVAGLLDYYEQLELGKLQSKPYQRTGGFARSWATSYTNFLDAYTQEITPENVNVLNSRAIYSRNDLLAKIAQEMSKTSGQNVLLVGEPGVGKQEIFLHLASRALAYETKTQLDGNQVRLLDLSRVITSAGSHEQLAEIMSRIFADLSRAGNVILFVNDIELLFDPSGKLGTVDASQLLGQYLGGHHIHLVGSITPEDYIKYIKPNSLLREQFSQVEVPPPDGVDLEKIILSNLGVVEDRYQVFFLLGAVQRVRQLAERYLKDEHSPTRELNLVEEVAAEVHAQNRPIVTGSDVATVVEKRVKVPIRVDEQEKTTLLNLAQELHKRIIGQDEAINQIADSLLRARAGLASGNRPVGSFLFLGPTGVGKTETAKALAQIYFGSAEQLIRLDMSEYSDNVALEKLLGVEKTSDPGSLTVAIQAHPSAVLLFDELEKASNAVKNALLQLLDEGRLTTNFGRVLDFTNTIIIATSNAGAEAIKQSIESNRPIASRTLVDQLISARTFLPELINRFDGVVVFRPLTPEEIRQVVILQIGLLQGLLLRDKQITLTVAEEVIEELSRQGYDPVFGARALQRVIKNQLETKIAREIISQGLGSGSSLTVDSI